MVYIIQRHHYINKLTHTQRLKIRFDYPSAGLSPANQDGVFDRIEGINDAGISIVMVELDEPSP